MQAIGSQIQIFPAVIPNDQSIMRRSSREKKEAETEEKNERGAQPHEDGDTTKRVRALPRETPSFCLAMTLRCD